MTCPTCTVDLNRWLDHRGPLNPGVVIQVIGEGKHTIPSHARTHAVVATQVRLIRETCAANHGGAA
jgi:hypothetical protein